MATSSNQTAISEASGSGSLPFFEKLRGRENYNDWAFAMKMYLRHEDLWHAVEGYPEEDGTSTAVKVRKDQKALTKICLMVQPACYTHVMSAETAKEAWDSLRKTFDDSGLTNRVTLLRSLWNIRLENYNKMEDYVNDFMTVSQKLKSAGKPIDDEDLGVIMLQGLPESYAPMIMAIEHSNVKVTSDLIKSKLLQDTNWNSTRQNLQQALWSKQKNSKLSKQQKKPWCWNCRTTGHTTQECKKKKATSASTSTQSPSHSTVKKQDDKPKVTVNKGVGLLSALDCSIKPNAEGWYVDSCCSSHMSNRKDWMINYDCNSNTGLEVTVANDQSLSTMGKGDVPVQIKDNSSVNSIQDVTYVPNLATNLLSVGQLVDKGYSVHFNESGCKVMAKDGKVMATASKVGGIYRLNTEQDSGYAIAASTNVSHNLWHQRLGHLNRKSMKLLRDKMATGVNFSDEVEVHHCVPCIEGKHSRLPFRSVQPKLSTEKLKLVHMDLCGPMPVPSWSGKRYFFTLIDDHTRKVFVYFLKQKSEVRSIFEVFKSRVENETGHTIKAIRSDNGTEFVNHSLKTLLNASGIQHQLTVAYSPQQNGIAERMNRTILDKVRAMLFNHSCDQRMWAEAVNTAVYLINRSPTKVLREVTPEEKWTGNKIDLSHLKVFGCTAYAHVPDQKRRKLDPKSIKLALVGYSEDSKGYRLFDTTTHEVSVHRDVIFLETQSGFTITKKEQQVILPSHPKYLPFQEASSSEEEFNLNLLQATNQDDEITKIIEQNVQVQQQEHPPAQENEVPQNHADNRRYPQRQRVAKEYPDFLLYHTVLEPDDPQTVTEALSGIDGTAWKIAMKEEINSLRENGAVELVAKPKNERIIHSKWVFRTKRDINGNVIRHRARLVAKGFTQQYGVDYFETFSPVIRHSSIRLLFAIAAQLDLAVDHVDVVTAFLHGDLDETIYMSQPEGFLVEGEEDKVYRLRKAVYGLKQSARMWNKKADKVLKDLGYKKSLHESCIYFKIDNSSMVIIALYVDDFFIFHNDKDELNSVKKELSNHFKIKDLGPISHCLGMKIDCDKRNHQIAISQKRYILDILRKFGMQDCKPVSTPLDPNVKFETDNVNYVDDVPYQQVIGCLMYLCVVSRPDIAYACSYLSQFNNKHTLEHWNAVKRVLRYLKGTVDQQLVYRKSQTELVGYVDADWASDVYNRKSFTGFVFKYAGAAVSWECRKQSTVAMSSTEAEYMALSDSTKEAIFLQELFSELVGNKSPILIYNDNQGAQEIANNPVLHRRTKHIDVRYHFIREKVENNVVKLKHLPTADMIADICTKALPRPKHVYCMKEMGMSVMT